MFTRTADFMQNSRDSVGFVFHKVSSEEAKEAGLDATFAASSILKQNVGLYRMCMPCDVLLANLM